MGLPPNKEELQVIVEKYIPHLKEIRQYLHKNPELGFQEYKTSQYVREILKTLPLDILPPLIGTDVVAFLNKNRFGKNMTLRADMDALPIKECTGLPYQSSNDGVMHACGHDGHTAMLLGAAMVLSEFKDYLKGSVRFVFQPAEENLCGGKKLVDAGALRNPEPNMVFGFHGWDGVKAGLFLSKPGVMTAACDTFKIVIRGKGGHSSTPEHAIDPIIIATKVIQSLKNIATDCFSPLDTVLVSVCKINSGTASNIIPETCEIEGSVRYLNTAFASKIKKEIKRILHDTCEMDRAKYEFNYELLYIPTINNKSAVTLLEKVSEKYFGKGRFALRDRPVLGAEDFSFFVKNYPGAFIALGLGEDYPGMHTEKFDFNDEVIKDGVTMFAALCLEYLR